MTVRLLTARNNPAFACVFHPQYENLYDKNNYCIKSICFKILNHYDDFNVPLDIVKPVSHCKILPWKLKPEIDTL